MTTVVKTHFQEQSTDELLTLLAGYQLLPQVQRKLLVDQILADIECTFDEMQEARQHYFKQYQIEDPEKRHSWLQHYSMTSEQLEQLVANKARLKKFKSFMWGHRLEAYFLAQKSRLDKVLYSLLRTSQQETAQELFFRIQSKEQSFAELAWEYSEGPEALTGGFVGPIELPRCHNAIAQILSISQPGQLWQPTKVGDWYVILRLEKWIPAQLDEATRQHLLDSLFEDWLQQQLATVP